MSPGLFVSIMIGPMMLLALGRLAVYMSARETARFDRERAAITAPMTGLGRRK